MCLLDGVYQVMVANCRNYHDTLIAAITGLGSDSKSIGPLHLQTADQCWVLVVQLLPNIQHGRRSSQKAIRQHVSF